LKHKNKIEAVYSHKHPENGKPDIFGKDGNIKLHCSFQFQLLKVAMASFALTLLTDLLLAIFVFLLLFALKSEEEQYLNSDIDLENKMLEYNMQHQTEHNKTDSNTFSNSTFKNIFDRQTPIDREFPSAKKLKQTRHLLAILFLFIIILLCSLAFFTFYFLLLTRRFSHYLGDITTGINQIADGDLECQIAVEGKDELALIAGCINEMALKIQENITKERQAEQEKNQLITSVAHDIRTPLTSILGYLELLYYRLPKSLLDQQESASLTPEQGHEYIRIAYDKSKRLMTLTEDLFTYTKVSFGELKMQPQPLNLIMLLEQMIEEFYPSFEDAGLSYHFSHTAHTIMLKGDNTLLARAFSNLISNAVKYGRDGKQIYLSAEVLAGSAVVTITNFGMTIPEEALSKIFDRFYRVENSRSLDTGGSGLGLSIAQRIILLHNGAIQAVSGLDGTSFIVTLPLIEEMEEPL